MCEARRMECHGSRIDTRTAKKLTLMIEQNLIKVVITMKEWYF